jgi:hypothetical protein
MNDKAAPTLTLPRTRGMERSADDPPPPQAGEGRGGGMSTANIVRVPAGTDLVEW